MLRAPACKWDNAVTFPQVPSVSAGLVSEAAQHLRRTHRPVYHRIIEGQQFRGQYVVGTQVLNAQELIALAEEKGFDACNRLLDIRAARAPADVKSA